MRRNPQVYNSNGRIKEPFSEIEIKKKNKNTHTQIISKGKTTTIPRGEVKSLELVHCA